MAKKVKSSGSFGPMQHIKALVCLILLLTTLASIKGVLIALFYADGAGFGTSHASMALIALAINVAVWCKSLCCFMGDNCSK